METQKQATKMIRLSDAEVDVEVAISIEMRTIDTDYRMAQIGQHSAIPDELLEPLWGRGLSDGVSDAVSKSGYDFVPGDLKVDIVRLSFSIGLDDLSNSDISNLAWGLQELAGEVSAQALDEIISSSSGQFAG